MSILRIRPDLIDAGTASDGTVSGYVLSAARFDSFGVSAQEISPQGVFFKPDGSKMYIVGNSGKDVNEYDTVATTFATVTYPSTTLFSGATPPAVPAIGEVDTLGVYTVDGGTTYYAYQLGDNHA